MELPNRHTTRAKWHNYNDGVYHITLNSRDRIHSFGEIKDGEMQLSELGQALKQYIESTHEHYPYAEIPIFQIMPDHVHLLVTIHQAEAQGQRKDDACIVQSSACIVQSSACIAQSSACIAQSGACIAQSSAGTAQSGAPSLDPKMKKVSDRRGYLSTVIGGIKSATTKYANAHDIPFAWVQRFYDVIIKDEIQMENTINYIKSNVANWEK